MQQGLVAQRRKLIGLNALQGIVQGMRVVEVLGQRFALQAAARLAQHIFKRSIDRHHTALRIKHRHRRGQQIKGQITGSGIHETIAHGVFRANSR